MAGFCRRTYCQRTENQPTVQIFFRYGQPCDRRRIELIFRDLDMTWTVILEDEKGNAIKTLAREFILTESNILLNINSKILKYLDPYGDTTFNAIMIKDLIADLKELENRIPSEKEQIRDILNLIAESENQVHTYIKFYGE